MLSEVQNSEQLLMVIFACFSSQAMGGVQYILPMSSHTFLTSRQAIMFSSVV